MLLLTPGQQSWWSEGKGEHGGDFILDDILWQICGLMRMAW